MLMIANHAHSDGTNAFPSVETLARECRMSDRQIIRIIQVLEESKELAIDRSAGRRSHRYSLPLMNFNPDKLSVPSNINPDKLSKHNNDKMSGLISANPDMSNSNPDILDSNPDIAMSPEPEPSKEPTTQERERAPQKHKFVKVELTHDEWLASLKTDSTYSHVDIDRELGKMTRWCDANNQTPSRRRFINWINKIDPPLKAEQKGSNNGQYQQQPKQNGMGPRTATIASRDYSVFTRQPGGEGNR